MLRAYAQSDGSSRTRTTNPAPLALWWPSEPNLCLTARSEVSGLSIQGDFSAVNLGDLAIDDSDILHSSFIATDLSRLRLVDVVVDGSDFSGAIMEDASLR